MNTENNNTPAPAKSAKASAKQPKTASADARPYKLPLQLVCTVTGKTVKFTSRDYIDAKIAEAGSLEKLHANYVSREGRRLNKEKAEAAKAATKTS